MLHRRPRLPQNPKTEEWHESGGKHLPECESMVVPWEEHELYSHTDPPATIQPLAAQGRALGLGLPCPGLPFPHLQSRESLSNGLDLLCRLKRHYTKYLGHGPRRERTPTKVQAPILMIFILMAILASVTFVSTPQVQVQVSI